MPTSPDPLEHNPCAWLINHLPPLPTDGRGRELFSAWQVEKNPSAAFATAMRRSTGMLTIARFTLNHYAPDTGPPAAFGLAEVRGLVELLEGVGETLDLAECAAQAALHLASPPLA